MYIHPSVFEEAAMIYIDSDTETVFMSHGGMYVDAGYFGADGFFVASEAINVSGSTPLTRSTFQEACDEFLAEDEEEEEEEEDDDDDDECPCRGNNNPVRR